MIDSTTRPPLKEYQRRAIDFAHKHPYSILALSPGLGKSRVAIEIQNKLKLNCLVVCPSYLISNWGKEISKWSVRGTMATLFKKGKDIYEPCDSDFVVTSYDLVQKAEHLFEWADMVVLDEGHALKSLKAKRTEFIHRVVYENSIKRLHILTGTPIKNRVQEFYSLLALCYYDPAVADSQFLEIFPSEIDFADHFSYRQEYTMQISGKWVTIMKWEGIKNVDELKGWLKDKYIRISSEVLGLPPVMNKTFQISDTDDPELLEAFTSYFLNNKKSAARSERTGSVLPEHKAVAALKKVPFTIKYVENLLEEVECLLVYSDHIHPAKEIAAAFNVEAITGDMPSNKRAALADRFQAGEGKILVCTVGAMKEGKDLFRASHVVFNDLPWVPGDIKQVVHRVQRMGQKATCFIHKILGSPQDAYISEVIDNKMKTIEKAT